MSIFAEHGARAGTLVAAAMETAGMRIQSDMLDLVTGDSGMMLAALLFLIGIFSGIFSVASGGEYRWGRYLLVGTPLFFFLTQVRIHSDGAEWQFADRRFPKEAIDKALEGVVSFDAGGRGGSDVAMFFQVWNIMVTDIVQYLVGLVNITASNGDLNFVSKLERYMNVQQTYLLGSDPYFNLLVKGVMVPECARQFWLETQQAKYPYFHLNRYAITEELSTLQQRKVFSLDCVTKPTDLAKQICNGVPDRGIRPKSSMIYKYTCGELWNEVVRFGELIVDDNLRKMLDDQIKLGQSGQSVYEDYMVKAEDQIDEASGILVPVERQDPTRRAVEELVARSLFGQFKELSPTILSGSLDESFGIAQNLGGVEKDATSRTADVIRQINETEKYRYKGDFINAALSMPHFQGVLLLMLSAAYPFFALLLVMPARATSFFLWMGLWVWVKSWDLGFAVVMMIDNILYAMFPRGPGLQEGEINQPGVAWMRILEQDPSFSAMTYYYLIATCLYAVPLISAFFVKKGGSELISAVHGSWSSYGGRLGNSMAMFSNSVWAQSKLGQQALTRLAAVETAVANAGNDPKIRDYTHRIQMLLAWKASGGLEKTARSFLGADTNPASYSNFITATADAQIEYYTTNILHQMNVIARKADYEASMGREATERMFSANLARFAQHPAFGTHYGTYEFDRWQASLLMNSEKLWTTYIESAGGVGQEALKLLRGGNAKP